MPGVGKKIATVHRVRARQVQHQIIRVRRHYFGGSGIFADDLIRVQGSRARAAVGDHEIDSERHWQAALRQSFRDHLGAIVRQAVMHDDGLIIRQAPEPRFWVAAGRIEGNRTDLDRTEAEARERMDGRAALVKAGG